MKQGFYIYINDAWQPTLTIPGEHFWCPSRRKQMFRGRYAVASVDSRGGINITRAEFESDGGSKPWFSWPIVGHPYDRHFPAYYDHDGWYDKIRRSVKSWRERRRLRKEADWHFRDMMRWLDGQHGIGSRWERFKKRGKHRTVRLFGWRNA